VTKKEKETETETDREKRKPNKVERGVTLREKERNINLLGLGALSYTQREINNSRSSRRSRDRESGKCIKQTVY
jgi:hypothetical protein